MKLKQMISMVPVLVSLAFPVTSAFAHVTVKPADVGVGAWQTFVTGVPNEQETPTTSVRLVIPAGLKHVMPNVKPGWTIEIKKEGTGDDATVTELLWKNGSVPVGQREEFAFSAQVPSEETELQWKAYQTYQNGTIVSWDQDPSIENKENDFSSSGPYSVTKVKNDLSSPAPATQMIAESSQQQSMPMVLSVVAIVLSGVAVFMAKNK